MYKIFYITPDIERAAGLWGVGGSEARSLHMVTNQSPLAEALAVRYPHRLVTINDQLSTLDLLRNEYVQKRVRELAKGEIPNILVFKTSSLIEKVCGRLGWKLLNPPYAVGAVLEEKIGQWRWLKETLQPIQGGKCEFELPEVWIGQLFSRSYKELSSELGEQPVVQFNRGHTGLGTFRLADGQQWNELQKKFSNREVKVSRFYEGRAFTVNAVAGLRGRSPVAIGNISEQLTGMPECTNNPYATVGNDWSEGSKLSDEIKKKIHACAESIGKALAGRGYQGMFGIDVIVTNEGKVILIEVNPRQPASASMESVLQQEIGETSMMERHVRSLQGHNITSSKGHARKTFSGFQIFFRNLENHPVRLKNEFIPGLYRMSAQGIVLFKKAASVIETRTDEVFAFSVSKKGLVKPGGELLRIQSKYDIFNAFGKSQDRLIQAIRKQIVTA